ncbi:hypothetical protein AB0D91_38825 [Streptomyces canus]|uniref:hypothetical protein n=1 Tax=Streptomyces canus TaxID=58343 RepID=UPI0033E295A2
MHLKVPFHSRALDLSLSRPEVLRDRRSRLRPTEEGSAQRFRIANRWPDETIGIAQACLLDDTVAARLGAKGNPWSDRVWADVIEAAPDLAR